MGMIRLRPSRLVWSTIFLLLGVAAGRAQSPSATPPPSPAPIRVMILGTYHFGNPNQDLHDVKADNMLTPKRQEELADLANRLARFAPTAVAVESTAKRPDFTDPGYEKFTAADLAKDANETTQIGYRLARQLGHKAVYDIDEQSETVDYFPFGKVQEFVEAHGQTGVLERLHADVQTDMAAIEETQKTQPVRLALARMNEPAYILHSNDAFYYTFLKMADARTQPGAELNAMWYMRNAKIFSKLTLTAKPGDRIVVIFGGGHCYWLRHLVEHTPGYQLVEPNEYLK